MAFRLIFLVVATMPVFMFGMTGAFDMCMREDYFQKLELGIPNFGTLDWKEDVCGEWNASDVTVQTEFYNVMIELYGLGYMAELPSTTRPQFFLRARKERLHYNVSWSGHHPADKEHGLGIMFLARPWSGFVEANETADFNFAFTCKKFEEVHYTQIFLYYTVKTVSPAELVSTARFKFFFKFLCNDIDNINVPWFSPPEPAPQVKISSRYLHRPEMVVVIVVLALAMVGVFFGIAYFELVVRKRWLAKAVKGSPDATDSQSVASLAPFEGFRVRQDEIVLGKEIGKGAFGVVYEGLYSNNKVAVKTLKCADETSEEQICRFLEEAQAMAQFNHPNILNLIGICLSDDVAPQILVPFMENGDLHSFLRRFDPTFSPGAVRLGFERLFDFALQIALGMDYLGRRNFVHRDLAARNCMLNSEMTVKVGDFGLGRDIQDEAYYKVSTEFMLPVKWMALESLQFYKFTTQSDVWSYGVVLWELMSLGQVPYVGVANHEILEHLKAGNRLSMPKHCPDKMYYLMLNCWSADANSRPLFSQVITTLRSIEPTTYELMMEKPAYLNHRPDSVDAYGDPNVITKMAGYLRGSNSLAGSEASTPMAEMPPARHFQSLAATTSSNTASTFRAVPPLYCKPEADEAAKTC